MFAVKHDGCHKAKLVADGHLIRQPVETIYSGGVSLKSLHLVMLLSELNQLELWGAGIEDAYIEACTKEKLFLVAHPKFDELGGHIMVMYKALFGTRTAGACWHGTV